MKSLLYTLAALLLAGNAMAQITISALPVITPVKVDSCNVPTSAALASLSSLAPATNGTWDFGAVALQPTPVTYAYKAKTAGFPSGTFIDSVAYSIGSPVISYNAWKNVQQSSGSTSILGEEILKRQAKGLGSFTGNNVDSIVFPAQVIAFANPLPVMKYPATMSSSWSATTPRVVNFNLTITAATLNNTPGQHKQTRSYIDSVVGWGRMKVPIVGKGASTYIAVLQVQHRDVSIDSYFVNGSPAPATLLTALGVSQGQSTTAARTYFYRVAAYRPLLEALHSTPSHSSAPSLLYLHALDLPEATAVHSIPGMGDITVYPNPVRGGMLHLDIPHNTQDGWSYTLINMAGQIVAQSSLSLTAAQKTTDIVLPKSLSAGIYYMTLMTRDAQVCVLPVVVE